MHHLKKLTYTSTNQPNRAVLLAAISGDPSWEPEASLAELERLAQTAGIDVVGQVLQHLDEPQAASYLGKGRLQDLKQEKGDLSFDTVIADDELTPAQQRRLEDVLDVQVLDRTAVILHIFAHHARSREGRLQVELAQYRYRLPRLTGHGVALSRLGGGINTRGPGETKLESDRRRIRRRISELSADIERVREQRAVHRRQRRASGLPVVALAGYTNAGKSTLINALTGAETLSSNQLFATLDPVTRRLTLPNGQEVLLTDTVGFIQRLPTDLVAAFRATLEEITEADIILHLIDASHPNAEQQAEAVEDELEELDVAETSRLTVLNKMDLANPTRLRTLQRMWEGSLTTSAVTGECLPELLEALQKEITAGFVSVRVRIPYADSEFVHLFRSRGQVEGEEHKEDGTIISGRLPKALLPAFQQFADQPAHSAGTRTKN